MSYQQQIQQLIESEIKTKLLGQSVSLAPMTPSGLTFKDEGTHKVVEVSFDFIDQSVFSEEEFGDSYDIPSFQTRIKLASNKRGVERWLNISLDDIPENLTPVSHPNSANKKLK